MGETVEKIVLRALDRVHRWNQRTDSVLLDLLKEDVNRLTTFIEVPIEHVSLDELDSRPAGPNPGASHEELLHKKEIWRELSREVEGDKQLEQILCCLKEGISKPKEIAEETGMSQGAIYNAQK